MNRQEVAHLLAVIQTYDSRTVGETDVIAWHGVLGDLLFAECQTAVVAHYSDSTDRIMPAHVRRRAVAVRQDRALRELPSMSSPDLVPKPDWFDTTKNEHQARTRALNDQRRERGEQPYYGETVLYPSDGRPR